MKFMISNLSDIEEEEDQVSSIEEESHQVSSIGEKAVSSIRKKAVSSIEEKAASSIKKKAVSSIEEKAASSISRNVFGQHHVVRSMKRTFRRIKVNHGLLKKEREIVKNEYFYDNPVLTIDDETSMKKTTVESKKTTVKPRKNTLRRTFSQMKIEM